MTNQTTNQTHTEKEAPKASVRKKPTVTSVSPADQQLPNPLNLTASFSPDTMFQPMRQMFDWMDAAFTSWPYRFDVPRTVFGDLSALETRADIAESDDAMEITMEVPGIEAEDIDVSVCGPILTVRGEKKSESDRQEKDMRHVERHYGAFRRSFRIPDGIDSKSIEADFDKGVLTLVLPKHADEAAAARKVEVKKS